MRTVSLSITASVLTALLLCTGCESPAPKKSDSPTKAKQGATPSPKKDTQSTSAGQSKSGARLVFTKENNPTSLAKRGEPSLTDQFRPAAWIYLDGKDGSFTDKDGQRHLEWVIEQPVSNAPTFRVEVYEPLLGGADEFSAVIETIAAADGTTVRYGLSAPAGVLQFGKDYNLLSPGPEFALKNLDTKDRIAEIAPLPAGRYLIAAGIKNTKTDAKTAAVTYFTVSE